MQSNGRYVRMLDEALSRPLDRRRGKTRGRVLAFVYAYTAAHGGVFPTLQMIVEALGLSNRSHAHFHLQKLVELGELEATAGPASYRIPGASYKNPPLPGWARPAGGEL